MSLSKNTQFSFWRSTKRFYNQIQRTKDIVQDLKPLEVFFGALEKFSKHWIK